MRSGGIARSSNKSRSWQEQSRCTVDTASLHGQPPHFPRRDTFRNRAAKLPWLPRNIHRPRITPGRTPGPEVRSKQRHSHCVRSKECPLVPRWSGSVRRWNPRDFRKSLSCIYHSLSSQRTLSSKCGVAGATNPTMRNPLLACSTAVGGASENSCQAPPL